jgi:hypothetical protein
VSADPSETSPATPALLQACRALLAPLAELAIARGLQHGDIDELLRAAFVDAALAAHPEVAPHRAVSRVSTATGLHRREVSRLIQNQPVEEIRPSPATQLFHRWLSDPALRKNGEPARFLPRQGSPLSFEALAQSVTKNVHPRSLLEELMRLGLVQFDAANDRVELLRDRFAPAGDEPRMLGFLASNVGDHLRAAVTNVVAGQPRHLEQAIFGDELSRESVQRLQPLVREQWMNLVGWLVPTVQKLIDEDRVQGRVQDQRVRVGLYEYSNTMSSGTAAAAVPPAKKASPARKTAPARRKTP